MTDITHAVSETSLRILRLPDVMMRVGLRRASIYAYVKDGRFPAPISLGARAVGWIESEVDGWVIDRIRRRN
jgi:prophage regulatory protein